MPSSLRSLLALPDLPLYPLDLPPFDDIIGLLTSRSSSVGFGSVSLKGESVGSPLGLTRSVSIEGENVGNRDSSVSPEVGLNEGDSVGSNSSVESVGEIVGTFDSDIVGFKAGLNVGDNDGDIVGFRAGLNVGESVGDSAGLSVGADQMKNDL